MKEYIILKTYLKSYDRLIVCTTSKNLLTYIYKIEKDLQKYTDIKHVLINQLLITGNNNNRFIKCEFSNGKLNLNKTKIVKPSNIKKEAIKCLHDNYHYVENSILTDKQHQNIKDNITF